MVEREILIGLVVERLDPSNAWGEPIWLPCQALDGIPEAPPWTILSKGADRVRYFAGAFAVQLYSTETAYYRSNLLADRPRLWVVMRPDGAEPPVDIVAVTADPTEGEGYTETGTNVVEVIDIPPGLAAAIAEFVDEHHVERVFEKRKRDKRPPQLGDRRRPLDDDRS
jgi:hypothetical protein